MHESPDHWPIHPSVSVEVSEELRKSSFCGNVSISHASSPNVDDCKSWDDLIMTTYRSLHGVAAPPMYATERIETEMAVLKRAQAESFPDEVHALQSNKPVHPNNRLMSLAPALDPNLDLILIGRQMVKKHQRQCVECRKWRGKPIVPKIRGEPR